MSPTGSTSWPFPVEALRPALVLALSLERASAGVLLLRDETTGALHPVVAEGLDADDLAALEPLPPEGGALRVAFERRRRTVLAAPEDEGWARVTRRLELPMLAVVPLAMYEEQIAGVIAALTRDASPTDDDAVAPVEWGARVAALAVDQALARRRAELDTAREHALGEARLQFLARMIHELRTPLQSIAGYIDLLSVDPPDRMTTRQQELLERVRRSERLLSTIVDDQITYARIEEGRVTYHLSPVSAEEALHAAAVVLSPIAAEHKVSLVAEHCAEEVSAWADPDKLLQILVNLAANALKFTPPGGTVRVLCSEEPGTVTFRVIDNGPGIPLDQLDAIFTPYVQLGIPTAGGPTGSGLGLAICREFATGMGGDLTVESTLESGSTFILRLPRYRAHTRPTRPQPARAARAELAARLAIRNSATTSG